MKVDRNATERQEKQPFKECPKYQVCSCNECPLGYLMLSDSPRPAK